MARLMLDARAAVSTPLLLLAAAGRGRDALRDELAMAGFEVSVGLPSPESLARHARWNAFRRERAALEGVVLDAADGAALDVLDAIRLRELELPIVVLLEADPIPPRAPRHGRLAVLVKPTSAAAIREELTRVSSRAGGSPRDGAAR
jgi:hypothetical protein